MYTHVLTSESNQNQAEETRTQFNLEKTEKLQGKIAVAFFPERQPQSSWSEDSLTTLRCQWTEEIQVESRRRQEAVKVLTKNLDIKAITL